MTKRLDRLAEVDRVPVSFSIDGSPATGLEGDTLLVAVLNATDRLKFF